MSGRRFVSAAWLLSICVVVGCASGPSRNFFSRRAKPSTSEDEFVNRLMADAKRLEKKGDREGANDLRNEANSISASTATVDNSTQLALQTTASDRGSARKAQNTSGIKTSGNFAKTEPIASSKRRSFELPDDVAEQPVDGAAQANTSSKRSPFSLNEDASATARLQLDGDADDFTKTLREPPQKRLGGGQFGIASRSPIEAPVPKRRSDAISNSADMTGPGQFQAPPDARELMPRDSPSDRSRELADAFNSTASASRQFVDQSEPNARGNTNFDVTSADYQTGNLQSDNVESGVVQAGAAETSANGLRDPANPWSRFRGLTKPLDPTPNMTGRNDSRPFAPNNVNAPQQWPGSSTNTGSFASQTGGQNSDPNGWQNNGAASPELWPRAPGANRFTQSNDNTFSNAQGWTEAQPVGAGSNPNHLQPVNNIQPTYNAQPPFVSAEIPGFHFPPQQAPATNTLLTESSANNAVLFPLPNGAPATIAPFASSPDLDRLIVQTSAEAAAMIPGETEIERQAYLRKHVQLRLLHLIAGQMDRALQPVPSVDAADQEFWQQMLWGVANYFDVQGMPDSAERATETIAQLRSAASRLQEKARLELHNVAFCHKITSFGNYQRFKRDEFTPGQPVLLYAEVASFKSEPTSDGQFRTLMKSSVEVFEGGIQGRLLESIPFTPSEDRCRNHRRDYFHSYEFAIPQGISSGPHVLRLMVEDQLGKKTAVTTLNFTVQ